MSRSSALAVVIDQHDVVVIRRLGVLRPGNVVDLPADLAGGVLLQDAAGGLAGEVHFDDEQITEVVVLLEVDLGEVDGGVIGGPPGGPDVGGLFAGGLVADDGHGGGLVAGDKGEHLLGLPHLIRRQLGQQADQDGDGVLVLGRRQHGQGRAKADVQVGVVEQFLDGGQVVAGAAADQGNGGGAAADADLVVEGLDQDGDGLGVVGGEVVEQIADLLGGGVAVGVGQVSQEGGDSAGRRSQGQQSAGGGGQRIR